MITGFACIVKWNLIEIVIIVMIYVFKTSVFTRKDIELLKPHLDKLPYNEWNFDLEDCDKILRIDGKEKDSKTIIRLFQDNGFDCEEL